jgi:cobalamin biosynthesis protein CobT
MRRLLEASATDDMESHRLSGTLDTRRLAASAWTGRVFARRSEEAGIDAAVIVLVDMSGSMSGERAKVAVPAAMALLETIESAQAQSMGVAFGDMVGPFKSWTETVRRIAPQAPRLAIDGGTNDAFSIRWCHYQLLRHPAPRKVLIVLTDGVGDMREARAQIKAGTRLGIRTIGIGIQADVQQVYGQGSPNVMALPDLAKVAFRSVTR